MSHANANGWFPRAGAILLSGALVLAVTWGAPAARAQDEPKPAGETRDLRQLQRDQEAAKGTLDRLDTNMKKIAAHLRERQPEEAARLDAAWDELKKRLVQDNMAAVIDGLKRNALIEAIGSEKKTVEDLKAILETLMNEKQRDPQEVRARLEVIAQERKELKSVLKDEREQKKQTTERAEAQAAVRTIEDAKKAIDQLAAEQKSVSDDPAKAGEQGQSEQALTAAQAAEKAGELVKRQQAARGAADKNAAAREPLGALEDAKNAIARASAPSARPSPQELRDAGKRVVQALSALPPEMQAAGAQVAKDLERAAQLAQEREAQGGSQEQGPSSGSSAGTSSGGSSGASSGASSGSQGSSGGSSSGGSSGAQGSSSGSSSGSEQGSSSGSQSGSSSGSQGSSSGSSAGSQSGSSSGSSSGSQSGSSSGSQSGSSSGQQSGSSSGSQSGSSSGEQSGSSSGSQSGSSSGQQSGSSSGQQAGSSSGSSAGASPRSQAEQDALSRASETLSAAESTLSQMADEQRAKLSAEEEKIASEAKALAKQLEKLAAQEKATGEKGADGAQPDAAAAKQALEDAARQAGQAGAQAGERNDKGAAGSAAAAQKSLEDAKKRLEGKKDLLGKRTPEQKQAAAQADLANRAQELSSALQQLQQSMAGQGGDQKAGEKTAQASQKTGEASQAMQKASESMGKGDSKSAQGDQKSAQQALDDAKKALEEEKQRILERLAKADLKKRVEKEKKNAEKADQLSQQMKQQQGGSESERQAGESASGASQSMKSAAQQMDEGDEDDAEKQQQQAIDELQKADEKLAEEERRYADMQSEQELMNFRAELEKAIESQTALGKRLEELDDRRRKEGKLSRKDRAITLQSIADEEEKLGEHAQLLVKKLGEENQVWVFARRLDDARIDLEDVVRLLRQEEPETGDPAQRAQADALRIFLDLKAAFEKQIAEKKKQQKQQQQQQQGGQGQRKLVPPLAELKMLKSMQEEVLRETESINEAIKLAQGQEPNPLQKELLKRLTTKQGNLADLLKQINDELLKAAAPGGDE